MKNLKLMVTGLAIVAVVGSSLAFTAMKANRRIFCQATNGQCTIPVDGRTTTANLNLAEDPCDVSGVGIKTVFGLSSTTGNCPLQTSTVSVYETSNVINP